MKFNPAPIPGDIVKPPIQIILASQSVGRRFLLEKLMVPFRAVPTNIEEDSIHDADPKATIKKRARAKALDIVEHPRVYSISQEIDSLVIGADSMALIGKKTYGKPETRDDAREMLLEMMDKTHTLTTAMTVIHYGKKDETDTTMKELKRWESIAETKVTMGKLSKSDLESYVLRYDLSRFAACYALNDIPWNLIEKIDGSYTNVIGLPFEFLLPIFKKLQIIA
jgi:septum formation protein